MTLKGNLKGDKTTYAAANHPEWRMGRFRMSSGFPFAGRGELDPWWQVDIGKAERIVKVKIQAAPDSA